MLTKLTIRNFKRLEEVEMEPGNPVVFIGPNNSGKTSAMQVVRQFDFFNRERSGEPKVKLTHYRDAGADPVGYRCEAMEREALGQ